MDFEYSDKVKGLLQQVRDFMDANVYPNEALFEQQVAARPWETTDIMVELKEKARAAGLWNLFLPLEHGKNSAGLSNVEYAPPAEEMGACIVGLRGVQLGRNLARSRQTGA